MNKQTSNILSISPVDGRYHHICEPISDYFSEFALIKYRVLVEIRYFISLSELPIPSLKNLSKKDLDKVSKISSDFSLDDAVTVKNIEKKINHDVKAVEYFIKEKFDRLDLSSYKEYIHFGLTSQDVNNTAIPLMLKDSINNILSTSFTEIVNLLHSKTNELRGISMIARTHGQPASPTTFGKEFEVFGERLKNQINSLTHIPNNGKFGGASGNLSAHYVSYPKIDWDKFSDKFLKSLGLTRSRPTTQIEHYDNMAAIFHNLLRINTILIDLCRDIWHYISINYLIQKVNKNEVGSSAMPHKVNPIDFENAEGNLLLANSQFSFLAEKLPISRLQRDLTDSTVTRNIGVPISHTLIAIESIKKGMDKIDVNKLKIEMDLENNWAVVSEAIQTILRRENISKPYELLKDLTRGNDEINKESIQNFIKNLPVSEKVKKELLSITPQNYIGNAI
mgnify:FL=1|tara:strand:+ start:1307 stop:2659 length:1353 start_codon:yes stop_codon:yes gene_type:complete